jgi:hypothetical protein
MDERRLRLGVRGLVCSVRDGEAALEFCVLLAQKRLLAQRVAEVEMLPPKQTAQHYDMKVNSHGLARWPDKVAPVRNGDLVLRAVHEASRPKRREPSFNIPERADPEQDVEHRLGAKPRH